MGRDEDTDILSRRGSRCLRCLKLARRESEALEKKRCLENCCYRPCAIMYISTKFFCEKKLHFHKLPHRHAVLIAETDHIEARGEVRNVDGDTTL